MDVVLLVTEQTYKKKAKKRYGVKNKEGGWIMTWVIVYLFFEHCKMESEDCLAFMRFGFNAFRFRGLRGVSLRGVSLRCVSLRSGSLRCVRFLCCLSLMSLVE